MKFSGFSRISAGAACLVVAFAGAAIANDGGVPTYKEFKADTYVDRDGQYIVNGDEPVSSDGALKQFYTSMVGKNSTTSKAGDDGLVVNTVNGRDDKWSASQALNLTYCVSTRFGTRHADVVNAMAGGAGLWESATSRVNFVYVSSQNGSCNTRNTNVLFSVEPVSTSQYIARAFFPSSSKRSRNVLIDDSIWSSGSWEPVDILAHELGHALGFRHEHTRPEAGTCFEDNNWRPLTPYDNKSIMHYPQCNGGSSDLEFQASDAAGVRALYGS
ncbi:M57 family metalloprotease [Nocardioides bizhenqiangii]|uniref:M57 family metalloprotease n=1 Tax=Nocardioides bizhenqiangii TaxID=3095076 RepID=A0ABZ0ZT44_9ACTN|nr:M57 family metalloprotease [Nocardioides sp. HM61]WQQ27478.1 M57 family metalloprotease [Nocardioides sp. HM61]